MKRAHHRCSPEEYDRRWLANIMRRTVTNEKGCILWRGFITYKGYGSSTYRGKSNSLHRIVYQVVKKVKLTKEQLVCHSCDVRNCINVGHLWIGSNDDNQLDAWLKGRKRAQSNTHCKAGHEFTDENTRRYSPHYRRVCMTCARIRNRIKAGWPAELAETLGVTPHGQRPVNARFPRKRKQRVAAHG